MLDNLSKRCYNKSTKEQINQITERKRVYTMEKKLTIVDKFELVKAILVAQGEDELADFIDERIAVQVKRTENRKPTKAQVANEGLKDRIVEILDNAEGGMTATEILNADVVAFGSVQKVTALLKALVDNGKVVKEVDKKKAFFRIAE